jgi:hypothetical protein
MTIVKPAPAFNPDGEERILRVAKDRGLSSIAPRRRRRAIGNEEIMLPVRQRVIESH